MLFRSAATEAALVGKGGGLGMEWQGCSDQQRPRGEQKHVLFHDIWISEHPRLCSTHVKVFLLALFAVPNAS